MVTSQTFSIFQQSPVHFHWGNHGNFSFQICTPEPKRVQPTSSPFCSQMKFQFIVFTKQLMVAKFYDSSFCEGFLLSQGANFTPNCCYYRLRGPFLEAPDNFPGPKDILGAQYSPIAIQFLLILKAKS